ncbi:MAG TPA: S1 RNA-binding domain-containing protein [Anaerolineales bacterium]|nr:S1 RNA-binding domain-containing protein [Anaerolineales bacterium]
MTNHKSTYENPMPVTDDGWWESVLAEDARHAPPSPTRAPIHPAVHHSEAKPEESPKVQPDWAQVQELYRHDQIVALKVTGSNRGGLLVEGEGLYGFVPFSHLVEMAGRNDAPDREKFLDEYVGKTLRLKVIECVPEDGRIVLSERAALAEPGKRSELFNSLRAGEHVRGTVTNITDFGVFVDLGGVEGLIHISELSWGRVLHPNQIVQMGQPLDVLVLDLSSERCRVALSLKRLLPNPWEKVATDFSVGQVLSATITSLLSYGAFARLDLGVEGLIHASEMSLGEGQTVKDILYVGQLVQVRILHVDAVRQRMGLSLRLDA